MSSRKLNLMAKLNATKQTISEGSAWQLHKNREISEKNISGVYILQILFQAKR